MFGGGGGGAAEVAAAEAAVVDFRSLFFEELFLLSCWSWVRHRTRLWGIWTYQSFLEPLHRWGTKKKGWRGGGPWWAERIMRKCVVDEIDEE